MTYSLLLFIPMIPLISYVISKMGWADLVENYQYDEPFTGTRVGIISATINKINYKNTLILKYNDEGVYIKVVLLFSLFHKPILIPWSEIKEVRNKKILISSFKELIIGHPFVSIIGLSDRTYEAIKNNIPQSSLPS
jgi:hypothetical protein